MNFWQFDLRYIEVTVQDDIFYHCEIVIDGNYYQQGAMYSP